VGVSVVLQGDVDGSLGGSVDELAEAFAAYREAGAGHLICSLEPATPESVEHVAQAAKLAAPR
jgi:hypothetical protein